MNPVNKIIGNKKEYRYEINGRQRVENTTNFLRRNLKERSSRGEYGGYIKQSGFGKLQGVNFRYEIHSHPLGIPSIIFFTDKWSKDQKLRKILKNGMV